MTDQPTGTTIEGTPWEEPRPPHLPDAVSGVSPWAIPFMVLAAIQVLAGWLEWEAQGDLGDPGYGVSIALGIVPAACISLLGAALLIRHPDALRRLPMLVFGVSLLAATVLLPLVVRALSDPLRLTEPTFVEDVYGHAINVVSAFGLVYVARGLDGARRRPDVVSVRGLGTILTVVVLLGAVATMLPAFVFGADELLTLGNVVALIMSVFVTLAWCYVFVISLGGWSAGESPRLGWLLVTIAAAIEILFRLLISVSGLLDISQAGAIVLWIISLAFVAVWVLFLLAFAAGLPSIAEPEAGDAEPETMATAEAGTGATADQQAATPPGSGAG